MKLKSSRVGIFSDIHIGLGQDSTIWHNNILNFARWAADVYTKKGINEILIPGDIFHNRNEIGVNTLSVASQFFDILKDFQIYISTGNHDCLHKHSSDVNSISLFKGWSNIEIIDDKPQIFTIDKSDKTLSMIPWGTELKDIPTTDYCVGHFEISSFKMNNQAICNTGIDSSSLLDKSANIISGHFHKRTIRQYDNGQIIYLGSPYQQNFGDVDEERGIYIFDLLKNSFEFIENKISPRHIKISLSNILNKKIPSSFIKENVPNNLVCLLIDQVLSPEEISLVSSKLQKLTPQFFRIDYKVSDKELMINSTENFYDSLDIGKNFQDFVEALDIEHKPDVISYLNDLYNKLAV